MLLTETCYYNKLNQSLIDYLTQIVGKDNIRLDEETLRTYSEDATEMCRIGKMAEMIVIPANAQEISAVLKLANHHRIPVIVRGGGTNLAGAIVPLYGGIILSVERLNKILEINIDNSTATVEAGVITGDFQQKVEELGFFYPPDPGSMKDCMIGGNIAQSASGPKALKYGATKDYVLGLEVVLANGEIIQTGGRTVKNVTGYNLTQLMIGSEGTLGIVTKAILRIIPQPKMIQTFLAYFDSIESASYTITEILKAKILPRTIELMDKNTLITIEKAHPTGLPSDKEAALLIEIDGHPSAVEDELKCVQDICKKKGCSGEKIAVTQEERDSLWFARRSAYPAMGFLKPHVISSDAAVPRDKIPQMVAEIRKIAHKYDLVLGIVGHAGDGNIHPHFAIDIQDEDEKRRLEKALSKIYEVTRQFGGTLSGEHGIGMEKKQFMEAFLGKQQVDVMKLIKQALDPHMILNPGKIF